MCLSVMSGETAHTAECLRTGLELLASIPPGHQCGLIYFCVHPASGAVGIGVQRPSGYLALVFPHLWEYGPKSV